MNKRKEKPAIPGGFFLACPAFRVDSAAYGYAFYNITAAPLRPAARLKNAALARTLSCHHHACFECAAEKSGAGQAYPKDIKL